MTKWRFVYRFFLFLVFVFFTIEFSLRILRPDALDFYFLQKQYHTFEPTYFVDLEANADVTVKHFRDFFTMRFTTNEMGFRGSPKVNNSLPQIACIGDSITMGFGVDDKETFCSRLDSYKDSQGQEYQSLNMGVDAYGPTAIAEKLEKFVDKLNIKLLYYLPSPGDDIDDAIFQARREDRIKYNTFKWQFLSTKHSYAMMGLRITQEQLVYRFRETFVWPYEKLLRSKKCHLQADKNSCSDVYRWPGWKRYIQEEFTFTKGPTLKELQTTSVGLVGGIEKACKDKPDTSAKNVSPKILQAIDRIRSITEKHGIRLVLLATPVEVETAYCAHLGKFHPYYDYILSLKKLLLAKDYEFLDMNDYAKRMGVDKLGRPNVRPYYIYGDGHYTKKGHDWIYEVISKKT
ncbi:MAG: hypothetical protein AAF518_13440, partial [Spirochaetota bacterium]